MRKLLLVRHSQTHRRPNLAPASWPLSDEGKSRCEPFSARLAAYEPAVIITSMETKAMQTGTILADLLGLPVVARPGLHEHERTATARLLSQSEFEAQVAQLFDQPDEPVFGRETAREALERFEQALHSVLAEFPAGNLAVVSHGTVIALLVARHNALDLKTFWKALEMPDLVELALPGFKREPA